MANGPQEAVGHPDRVACRFVDESVICGHGESVLVTPVRHLLGAYLEALHPFGYGREGRGYDPQDRAHESVSVISVFVHNRSVVVLFVSACFISL